MARPQAADSVGTDGGALIERPCGLVGHDFRAWTSAYDPRMWRPVGVDGHPVTGRARQPPTAARLVPIEQQWSQELGLRLHSRCRTTLTEPSRLGRAAEKAIERYSWFPRCQHGKSPRSVCSGSCLGKLPQTDVLLVAYSRHLDGLCAVRLSGSRGPRTARWTFGLGPSGSFRPDDRRAGNDRVRGYQHRRSRFRSLPRRTDPLVTRIAPELFALKKSAMSVKFAALQWFSTQDDMR